MSEWQPVLDFWFPEGTDLSVDPMLHGRHWKWRMRGGADGEIIARFTETAARGAEGEFDHWAADPLGRMALIIVLDQFPRSIHRDSPLAYAQDGKALALCLEGHGNGHYDALPTPWHKTTYNLPLGHCEGPDHLARLDRAIELGRAIRDEAPQALKPGYEFAASQPVAVRAVIAAFGRHPHRNAVLGRASTPEEEAYIAKGDFPHLRSPPSPPGS